MIKRASEILLDASKRHSYDDIVRTRLLRKKRDAEAAEDVRMMKSDLQAREAEAYLANRPKADASKKAREDTAAYRAERAAKKAEEERKKEALRASLPASFHITTVMLKWDAKVHHYSEGDISHIVKPFGSVEATLMLKSGGAATIVCSSESSANAIVAQLSPSSPLGSKHGFTHAFLNQSTAPTTGTLKSTLSVPSQMATSSTSPLPKSPKTNAKLPTQAEGTPIVHTSLQQSAAVAAPSTANIRSQAHMEKPSGSATTNYAVSATIATGDANQSTMTDEDFEDMVLAKMKNAKRNKLS